jgi:hypothetical protein
MTGGRASEKTRIISNSQDTMKPDINYARELDQYTIRHLQNTLRDYETNPDKDEWALGRIAAIKAELKKRRKEGVTS